MQCLVPLLKLFLSLCYANTSNSLKNNTLFRLPCFTAAKNFFLHLPVFFSVRKIVSYILDSEADLVYKSFYLINTSWQVFSDYHTHENRVQHGYTALDDRYFVQHGPIMKKLYYIFVYPFTLVSPYCLHFTSSSSYKVF